MRTDEYPQLRQLCWNAVKPYEISRRDAFGIYEGNWRHVVTGDMCEEEREFILSLLNEFGPSPVIRHV